MRGRVRSFRGRLRPHRGGGRAALILFLRPSPPKVPVTCPRVDLRAPLLLTLLPDGRHVLVCVSVLCGQLSGGQLGQCRRRKPLGCLPRYRFDEGVFEELSGGRALVGLDGHARAHEALRILRQCVGGVRGRLGVGYIVHGHDAIRELGKRGFGCGHLPEHARQRPDVRGHAVSGLPNHFRSHHVRRADQRFQPRRIIHHIGDFFRGPEIRELDDPLVAVEDVRRLYIAVADGLRV
mmetsp:Transcript_52236/g.122513  ORF Transcript_52236/g.122513 Transcript_52236/m.122513 type:complete len:236 (+) Transcript_52236:90-797(+)